RCCDRAGGYTGNRQFSQPSPGRSLPSSQSSPGSITRLPHNAGAEQSASQPSPEMLLPSSHASPGSTWPSPQCSGTHSTTLSDSAQRKPAGHTAPPGQSTVPGAKQPPSATTASTQSRRVKAHPAPRLSRATTRTVARRGPLQLVLLDLERERPD